MFSPTSSPCEPNASLPQIVLLEMNHFAESKCAVLKILGNNFFRILQSPFFLLLQPLFQIMLFNLLSNNAIFKVSLLELTAISYPFYHAVNALRPLRFLLILAVHRRTTQSRALSLMFQALLLKLRCHAQELALGSIFSFT